MADRRLTPLTDRVVARHLAEHYPDRQPVDPDPHFVTKPFTDLSLAPGGPRDRQLRYGEAFDVLETRETHAYGAMDGGLYHGWLPVTDLSPANARSGPTHYVATRQTHAYTDPDFKSPDRMALPHLARLSVGKQSGQFLETELGWVPIRHLADQYGSRPDDPVTVAALYLGAPYLWGGDTSFGIDCSGLVSAALAARGHPAPRDSDLQSNALGQTLPADSAHKRGDLLFWRGHVAWVVDPDTILHANAFHMAVTFEPLQDAIARIHDQGDGPVTRHARL